MNKIEVLVIGGGPAGLSAAKTAASLGAKVLLCERDTFPGGQLVKQTHKFFGSEKQDAGERGIHIGQKLLKEVQDNENIELMTNATVVSSYEDNTIGILQNNKFLKYQPEKVIIATGAAEKFLVFSGNYLPGVYGAGAVQTLMNVAGVKPADRVLMIGSGNIGLIVSYQLKQAGVDVAAIIEAAPKIGGYLVHASKIRRASIPILTGYTILEAYGEDKVEGAKICRLDDKWKPVPGTEEDVECDAICLAVGLSPLTELCWQSECEMMFVKELSGHVPVIDENMETSKKGIYVAGDVTGIEEASSAMVEGRLAGYAVAESLGYGEGEVHTLREAAVEELKELRAGPMGLKIRQGIETVEKKGGKIHVNLNRYTQ